MADWVLTYPGTSFVFGSRESGYGFVGAPDLGDVAWETGDVDMPGDDVTLFGRDVIAGRTITFRLDVIRETELEARAALGTARLAWRADAVRKTPGSFAALRAGSGRMVFGRPRRFWSDDTYVSLGASTIDCDFKTADDLWYGAEQSTSVSIAPAVGGGLVAPLAAPLATTESSDRSTAVTVGGTVPTWGIYTVRGPISGPVVELVGKWRLSFPSLNLAYDQSLVIDTRPWARTIMRGGGSVAGSLAPGGHRLQDTGLPPGTHELVLRGTSLTGTASLTARWRDAFTTP